MKIIDEMCGKCLMKEICDKNAITQAVCLSYKEAQDEITALKAELAIRDKALELSTKEEAKAINVNCPQPEDECTHCNNNTNSCHKVIQLNYIDVAIESINQAKEILCS